MAAFQRVSRNRTDVLSCITGREDVIGESGECDTDGITGGAGRGGDRRGSCVGRKVLLGRRGREYVASAAPSVDEWSKRGAINFTAKAIHVNLNRIGERIVVVIPHVGHDIGARDHATRLPCEQLK